YVTSRSHLSEYLEKRLNVGSMKIQPLIQSEQEEYIQKRLNISNGLIEDMFQRITNIFGKINHREVLGVPLHISLFTNLLENEPTNVTILKTYNYFIEEKFNIYYKKRTSI